MSKYAKHWHGKVPTRCDICGSHSTVIPAFSDIKTRHGPWGIVCDACVPSASIALAPHYGVGLGQRYARQSDGRYMKTHG